MDVPDDNSWSAALAVSLPLYEGGSRGAQVREARERLEELRTQREATADRISQGVRSASHAAASAFSNLELSREAAAAAARTLEVVKEAYAQGAADILALLDAQNATLVTELVASDAVYDFMLKYTKVSRSAAMLDALLASGEREALFEDLKTFMQREQQGNATIPGGTER
jgi:outer membrane protein